MLRKPLAPSLLAKSMPCSTPASLLFRDLPQNFQLAMVVKSLPRVAVLVLDPREYLQGVEVASPSRHLPDEPLNAAIAAGRGSHHL